MHAVSEGEPDPLPLILKASRTPSPACLKAQKKGRGIQGDKMYPAPTNLFLLSKFHLQLVPYFVEVYFTKVYDVGVV